MTDSGLGMSVNGKLKIDVFSHIAPQKFLDVLLRKVKVIELPPALSNLELRFSFMDKFECLVQVLSLSPFDFASLDNILNKSDSIEMCRMANDEMAELRFKYPERFIGVCAAVPMSDINAALKEIDRAINDLGFCGVEIFTDVNGKPLDSPEFRPFFEKMNHYNLPILLHPAWRSTNPEYPGEKMVKYLSVQTLTFPYQTTLALNRLVFSGIMKAYPNLKIVAHHCGGLLPFIAGRVAFTFESSRVLNKSADFHKQFVSDDPLEYFRQFYGDTVAAGNVAALMCSYQFFGGDRLLFGTDAPFDDQAGARQTGVNIRTVEQLDISEEDKRKIFALNAIKLFRLPLTIIEN